MPTTNSSTHSVPHLTLHPESTYPPDAFPDDLKSLTLEHTPFSAYKTTITKLTVKTLTEFHLNDTDPEDKPDLSYLLDFLENNPALNLVEINIPNESKPLVKQDRASRDKIKLPQLASLSLKYSHWEDAEYLISNICIPASKETELKIEWQGTHLNDILESIGNFASSPTQMDMDLCNKKIELLGPNGKLSLCPIHEDMCIVLGLTVAPEGVDITQLPPKPSLKFPALKTIIIKGLGCSYPTGALKDFINSFGDSLNHMVGYRSKKVSKQDMQVWQKECLSVK